MKKALLVGLNKYKNPGSDLRGCVNDVIHAKKTLGRFGFKPDNIRLLLNERATRHGILTRLDWLMQAKPGDTIVFHFSGHGSQIRDRNGDELNDKLDELICPYDMDWNNPLSDDILKKKFSKLKNGVRMYLIFDCCHSGTMDRGNPEGNPDHTKYRKQRFLHPPLDILHRAEARELPMAKVGMKNEESKWSLCKFFKKSKAPKPKPKATIQKHVMMSGCKDTQTSADAYIGGDYNGALSWMFFDTLAKNPGKSVKEIHKITRDRLKNSGYSQIPQLWGPQSLLSSTFFK